jgi:aerobic carbon-monoxide dehydrogenase medium subunit
MAQLHRPGSLDEAVELLSSLDNPMVYGGGTAIQILIKQGILFADHFVDLATVPGLREVTADDRGVTVGPMVSIRRMETAAPPLAADAYRHVANPRVRNTASVGGNLAHGDYRLDPPTALLVLDAVVLATSVEGTREIPVREFFTDFQETALEPGEMVSGVRIPHQDTSAGYHFEKKSSLGENDWPAASAAVLLDDRTVHIGLGAVAPVPVYVTADIAGLDDQGAVDAAIAAIEPVLDPIPDVRGGVGYKRRLARVTVEDAVRRAWKDRNHG